MTSILAKRTAAIAASIRPEAAPSAPAPAPAAKAAAEGRKSTRKSTRLAGLVVFNRGRESLVCSIRDLSATGARIKLQTADNKAFSKPIEMPDAFTLVMRVDRLEVDCEVIWRKGGEAGLRFLSAVRPMTAQPK
jgi:hypothetical protein